MTHPDTTIRAHTNAQAARLANTANAATRPPTMTVTVRDIDNEPGCPGNSSWPGPRTISITIPTTCPHCGRPRGTPTLTHVTTHGHHYRIHRWTNPCGHIDLHTNLITEARKANHP